MGEASCANWVSLGLSKNNRQLGQSARAVRPKGLVGAAPEASRGRSLAVSQVGPSGLGYGRAARVGEAAP